MQAARFIATPTVETGFRHVGVAIKALVVALEYTTGLLVKRLEAVGDVLEVIRSFDRQAIA